MQNKARILGAEAFGTAVLMIAGVGTAVLAPSVGTLGIALAFGLTWLVMTYVIGPISGAQMNPAVSLALWLTRRISAAHAGFAVIGQVIGAILGGFIVWGIGRGSETFQRGRFAANGFKEHSPGGYGLGGVMVAEMVFTALFVTVVLFTANRKHSVAVAGVASGLMLAVIHLVMMSIDGTSVNPARSVGSAIFADSSSDALKQVWVFILFPLIGGVVAVFLFLMLDETTLEDTLLDNEVLRDIRDVADKGMDAAVDAID
jgi:aquaporin Z